MNSATLVATGLVTPVGIGARATWAAVRGGISHIRESGFIAADGQPIRLSSVPDDCLEPLPEGVATHKSTRFRRLLQLAITALAQIGPTGDRPIPIFLGLPEPDAAGQYAALEPFLADIARCCDHPIDLVSSRVFASGRASGFQALEAAIDLLSRNADPQAMMLVGGVDTYLDPLLLAQLEKSGRLLMDQGDGFIPGEGAAFVLLRRNDAGPGIQLGGVANAQEPGHLKSETICRGEGLTQAFGQTLAALQEPVASVFCGLNGENASGKEWGLSAVRLGSRLSTEFTLYHPADCYGDPGAASAPLLWCLGGLGLAQQQVAGPLLTWCASDGAPRGSAVLTAAG